MARARHGRGLAGIVCLMLMVAALGCGEARAQDAALAGLHATGYQQVSAAVTALAASGDPRAAPVITALHDQKLYAAEAGDGLYIETDTGYLDAATGAPATPDPDSLRKIRLNNRVRGVVDNALAVLALAAPDPATRRAAAVSLYNQPNAAMLPALERAIAAETSAATRRALVVARAAALLSPGAAVTDGAARIAAVKALGDAGGPQARSILLAIPSPSPALSAAIGAAITAIDRSLKLWSFGQDLFYGLSLGSVLMIAAMGLAITFGVMGVINMAHGELMMIGAYVTFIVQHLVLAVLPGAASVSLLLAIPAAFVVCGALGVAIERGMIRFLYGRPLETLLATWGLSLVLQQAVRSIFGPSNVAVVTPPWMSGAIAVGGLQITLNRLVILVFAVAVMVGLMLVLRATPLGLQMRAVTQNRRMASLMGIRTVRVDALTFALGSGVAGLAGVAISQIDNVSPNLGQGYIIDSFMVVVFGGVGNLWGTLAGALTLGVANKVLEPIVGAVLGKIVVLVLIILFIQRRPRGLFPLKGRAVES